MKHAWMVAALSGLLTAASVVAAPVGAALERPAVMTKAAARSVLQGAARAGEGNNARLVAVGERGIVVLSDDQGQTWRQVPIPVSVGLTAVRFVDAQHGWAVGHGAVVLATQDGGQTWVKQLDGHQAAQLVLKAAQGSGDARAVGEAERLVADGADKPLLDLHFFDANRGIVIGAYNLAFVTEDGGKHWQPIQQRLDNPKALHLYTLRVRGQQVLIAGEQGLVLRSTDGGQSFQRLVTPYKGSFFTAELPGDQELVLAGLRGNVWRSVDGGANWAQIPVAVPVSFTASVLDASGQLWLANQAGMVFTGHAAELHPVAAKLPPLTGLLLQAKDRALGLSIAGVVPIVLTAPQGMPK